MGEGECGASSCFGEPAVKGIAVACGCAWVGKVSSSGGRAGIDGVAALGVVRDCECVRGPLCKES